MRPDGHNHMKYPFETRHLKKGDVITTSQLEHAFGITRDEPDWRLKLLEARRHVEHEFEARGEAVTVSTSDDSVRILTDEEAVAFNERAFAAAHQRMVRSHVRTLGIDRSMLGPASVVRLDRNLTIQAARLSADREARRIALRPVERKTPVLTEESKK